MLGEFFFALLWAVELWHILILMNCSFYSVTPLKANFMHFDGLIGGEIKL